MKCHQCGFESELDYPVCPQCQAQIQSNPAAQSILKALKDSLFLVICILFSVSVVMALANDSLSVPNILIAVFLWLTYAQSQKGTADAKHLRCISGAVYANYVITYVAAGLILLLGVIFTAAFGLIADNPSLIEGILADVTDVDVAALTQMFAVIPSAVILTVFVIVAAIIVVMNIFSLRYIHRFAQSIYKSIEAGALNLKYVDTAKIWLFVFGGFSAINCLSALFGGQFNGAISSGADAAACILAGLLIRKYFTAAPAPVQQLPSEE